MNILLISGMLALSVVQFVVMTENIGSICHHPPKNKILFWTINWLNECPKDCNFCWRISITGLYGNKLSLFHKGFIESYYTPCKHKFKGYIWLGIHPVRPNVLYVQGMNRYWWNLRQLFYTTCGCAWRGYCRSEIFQAQSLEVWERSILPYFRNFKFVIVCSLVGW